MPHEPPAITDQVQRAAAHFQSTFGRTPRHAAAAPGRVNLIGEHTDYNDGFVLPMAIERQTVIVADPRPDAAGDHRAANEARLVSTALPGEARFVIDQTIPTGEPTWANYVRGVVAGYAQHNITPPGFDAVIDSTVPTGGGLSSSAALEVATATLIEALAGQSLDGKEKALLCQSAEHTYAGMPCGIMDQFICALAQPGHALLIDCRTHETRPVPLHDPEVALLVVNTNVEHKLVEGEYAARRAQCEAAAKALGVRALRDATPAMVADKRAALSDMQYRRAHHVIGENERTQRAAEAMSRNDWTEAGRLMGESHRSLRDDFEVSCRELDLLVELANEWQARGAVYGARMTGGGFGGCTVTLLRADMIETVTADLTQRYEAETAIAPTAFATGPASGARVVGL